MCAALGQSGPLTFLISARVGERPPLLAIPGTSKLIIRLACAGPGGNRDFHGRHLRRLSRQVGFANMENHYKEGKARDA